MVLSLLILILCVLELLPVLERYFILLDLHGSSNDSAE